MEKVELMAPAGSFESLMAAIKANADSVYFGLDNLNMRRRAARNFQLKDLAKVMNICRKNQVNGYLTLNTIMYDDDLSLMRKICDRAKKAGVNAIIAHDISVLGYCKSKNIPVHLSTQANISNIEAVKFYSQFGDALVLARELSLDKIKEIANRIKKEEIKGPNGKLIRIELFAHGALCVSIAGKCHMSLATYNQPANRGECLQNCRRAYKVIDEETGDELIIDNKYVMSPKDLCTIGFIDKLINAGAGILKIEGRGRAADYVYTTTKVYLEAINSFYEGTYSKEKIAEWVKRLETTFNRGFWHGGYYLGKKLGEWAGVYGSKATKEKIYVGVARNYFAKPKVAHFVIETGCIKVGDDILITGPTTGLIESKVSAIHKNEKKATSAKKGDDITIPITEKVRKNDKLFVVVDKADF
ncbi:MAG TPA: peptidase U32 family protein [Candidatus Nanoarchaeia archaeon]|nr:peptidase U32 family protein [Candidatus Nanoarchaeia archaeon]